VTLHCRHQADVDATVKAFIAQNYTIHLYEWNNHGTDAEPDCYYDQIDTLE
jgi:hypothetical protein